MQACMLCGKWSLMGVGDPFAFTVDLFALPSHTCSVPQTHQLFVTAKTLKLVFRNNHISLVEGCDVLYTSQGEVRRVTKQGAPSMINV